MAISVVPPGPEVLSEAPRVVCLSPSDPKKSICKNIPPIRSSRWCDAITQRSQLLFPVKRDDGSSWFGLRSDGSGLLIEIKKKQ